VRFGFMVMRELTATTNQGTLVAAATASYLLLFATHLSLIFLYPLPCRIDYA
jgi:hypothetical protein